MITIRKDDRIVPVNLDTTNSMVWTPRRNVAGSAMMNSYELDEFKVVEG